MTTEERQERKRRRSIPKEEWCVNCWLYEDRGILGKQFDAVWDFKTCREACWKDIDIED